ncbi:MAG TPA: phosphate ABC transporter permease subunit PstC [Candidatus Bathyarchaeia archaeon]|nr:phosphate ABC transporter permease subunit PstC [Candidatus Bathyarchaeia archaeon]
MGLKSNRSLSSDTTFKELLAIVSGAIIVIIGLTVLVLIQGSLTVLNQFGFSFLSGAKWNPVEGREVFGVLPYVLGTLATSGIAILLGVPISIGIAVFLSEMSIGPIRTVLSQLIELLAAVPSVIYGLWGLLVLRYWVRDWVEPPLSTYLGSFPGFTGAPFGLDLLTAGLILTIMIIPTVSVISKEVMMAVPSSQREAAYSIGATKWEVVRIGVLSYARSGIFGAAILGLGRAVGETMAVTMIIGNTTGANAIPTSLLKPSATLSSIIANEFNEATTAAHTSALIGAGLVLFMLAATINIFAQLLVWRVLKVKSGAVE